MKILALDFGKVRTGVAIGDSNLKIAFPKDIIKDNGNILEEIKKICLQENVEKIVIGLPKNLANTESAQTKKTNNFKESLEKYLEKESVNYIDIVLFDERYSTKEAETKLKQVNTKNINKKSDSIAASNFLQTFLEQI